MARRNALERVSSVRRRATIRLSYGGVNRKGKPRKPYWTISLNKIMAGGEGSELYAQYRLIGSIRIGVLRGLGELPKIRRWLRNNGAPELETAVIQKVIDLQKKASGYKE